MRSARGIINIIIGVVFIIGGLSGRLVLVGTQSGPAIAAVGLFLVGLGVWRMTRPG